jgi:hypothetical protein
MSVKTEFYHTEDRLTASASVPIRNLKEMDRFQPLGAFGPFRAAMVRAEAMAAEHTEYPYTVELDLLGGYRLNRTAPPGDPGELLVAAFAALDELDPNASFTLAFERVRERADWMTP